MKRRTIRVPRTDWYIRRLSIGPSQTMERCESVTIDAFRPRGGWVMQAYVAVAPEGTGHLLADIFCQGIHPEPFHHDDLLAWIQLTGLPFSSAAFREPPLNFGRL